LEGRSVPLSQIGALGRRLRQARGLTLRELDKRTGISQGYLSQLETGVRWPSPEMAERWFAGLGAEVAVVVRSKDASP
jgi:transcriptional regulator with XRE-family HTH domain